MTISSPVCRANVRVAARQTNGRTPDDSKDRAYARRRTAKKVGDVLETHCACAELLPVENTCMITTMVNAPTADGCQRMTEDRAINLMSRLEAKCSAQVRNKMGKYR